ncbi:hypothetical protein FXO38_36245 [Capsicum annuum]|nr:hypothetical protein FXO37_36518 [Capsicum annuum]KAF3613437.1 hypothetical protein FXO38_36245 [Capsicum annuum]
MSRESLSPTNALRREIEDKDFLTQCGHWMEKTNKGTTHRKGIPQGAPISPDKDLSARSRPMDRKKNAGKENERRNPNLLWECEIGRRGVCSRTTAVIAELIRWAAPNLELTFKSEIDIGSWLSEKCRLKRKITKCNITRGSLDRSLREGRS